MQKLTAFLFAIIVVNAAQTQPLPRPKLVVGVVVDQMRWDYLYRYYNRYSTTGGFRRMLSEGFTCDNTFIPYVPTVTACGHASIFTGSVPAVNGIAGNYWYDYAYGRSMYCTEDSSVKTVGSNTTAGMQSPRNMLVNTIGDELRLATNFKSKVVGVALKDRGSILPAGHSANGAYWYDSKTGEWITSTFYMDNLPQWVKDLNAKKLPDQYYKQGWNTLYPMGTYNQSTIDENKYEGKPFGTDSKGFPYNLNRFAGSNYGVLPSTPAGNTFTLDMAKAAIENEQLGADEHTDLLTVSFSSPDYVGHAFGPNSIEAEDIFLRLDKELGEFFDYLDAKVGKGEYTVFLSADHGVAHVPAFVKDNRMPGGHFASHTLANQLNAELKKAFKKDDIIIDITNHQVVLNLPLVENSSLKLGEIKTFIINYLNKVQGIARAFDMEQVHSIALNKKIAERVSNGYYPPRGGQIQIVLQSQLVEGFGGGGTSHGVWNPYDSHIPLVWYGWGIKQGRLTRETYMTDIAPTVAALLHIQMPNGTVGDVISEVMK